MLVYQRVLEIPADDIQSWSAEVHTCQRISPWILRCSETHMFVLVASHFSLGILLRLNLFFSHVHPHCFMVVCFFFSMFHCLWVKPYVVQWLFSTAMITRGSLWPSTIKFSCFLYLKKHQFPIFFLEKIVFFPQNHHCSIFFPGKNHVFSTKPPFFHIFPWKKSWFLFRHHHVMSRPVVPRCRPLAFLTGTQQRAEGCHICLDLHRLGGTNNDWWCTRRQGGAPVG